MASEYALVCLVNLKEWARVQGVHPVTGVPLVSGGEVAGPGAEGGRLILVEPAAEPLELPRVAAYCGVSSADQKDDWNARSGGSWPVQPSAVWRWARWCPRSGRA